MVNLRMDPSISTTMNSKYSHDKEDLLDPSAAELAAMFKKASLLLQDKPHTDIDLADYDNDLEALQTLPLHGVRIDEALLKAPRRSSRKPNQRLLAKGTSKLLFPAPDGSLTPIIRYEHDRIRFRKWDTPSAQI
ncbi:hypothetical protein EJ08DRAFT_694788 [Tothia fuscella]|uniref:Uncharacterized protein n=1 Tax=Tothia fuscella TaxID=1048955 RepID=A0A9P4U151_9PEZI|nr:hypothetical protein EJ08DRAFT_694788 [Tothia fuscella]